MTAESEIIKRRSESGELDESENTKSIKRHHDGDENITKKKKKYKKKNKNKSNDSSEVIETPAEENVNIKGSEEQHGEEKEEFPKKKPKREKVKKEEKVAEEETEKATEEDEDGEVKKKKGPSKREIKRQKAELRAAEAKEVSRNENAQKALNYISKWKHARSEWKFEKLRQVWLIDNLLIDKYIPDDHFPTVIEYFEGCKGLAKKQLIDKAMAVIKKVEESIEEDEELIETTEYKRARHLLQALPS